MNENKEMISNVLGSLKELIADTDHLQNASQNKDFIQFDKVLYRIRLLLDKLKTLTLSFENVQYIKYNENLENLIYSLNYITIYSRTRSYKLNDKIQFEYLPLLKEFYFIFYYFSSVYGDDKAVNIFAQNEYDQLTENTYYKKVVSENGNFKYDVSIIVCGYNKLEHTKICLNNIIKYTPSGLNYEIILINNGSSDGTHEYFETLGVKKYINIKNNSMISGAAGRISEGKYICSISNDVYVTKNYLTNLIKCIESDEKILMVVPTTSNVSNLQSIPCKYDTIEKMEIFAEKNNISNSSRWEQRSRLVNPITLFDASKCTRYSKELMLADKYFMFYEFHDDAVCTRIRRLGFKMILAKDCFCHHVGSLTLSEGQKKENTLEKSRKLFFERFNVDAYSNGFCFDRLLINALDCNAKDNVKILGINAGFGSNPLKIKDVYKELGIEATVYNATSIEKYIIDLKGVSDHAILIDSSELSNVFINELFDYIIIDSGYNNSMNIKDFKARLKDTGVLIIFENSKNELPKANKAIQVPNSPNGENGNWHFYNAEEKYNLRTVFPNEDGRNKLTINIVYGHLHQNDIRAYNRGNISIIWTPLPIKGCDHYVYHNAFSYRGRLPGLNILLMLEPAVVLPGEFDERIWKHFDYVFGLFDALIGQDNKFHKIFFPCADASPKIPVTEQQSRQESLYPLSGRKNAICMINGNKRSHVEGELYSKRIEIAQWFFQNSTMPFDVYGRPPFALPNYRGVIPDGRKLAVLKQYRFSLCFENTNHSVLSAGYVTEKIIDCLETRTIPIYLGASNIEKYIPEDCFIDYRKFATFADLEQYLQTMSDKDYKRLISAIDQWIAQGNLRKYSIQPFYDSLAQLCAEDSAKSLEMLFDGEKTWTAGKAIPPTAQGWQFVSTPEMWTWKHLSRAEAPVVENGELIRRQCKTFALKHKSILRYQSHEGQVGKLSDVKISESMQDSIKDDLLGQPNENIYKNIQAMVNKGMDKAAIMALGKLLKSYPNFALAHNDLGVLYYNAGKKDEALEHYQKAAELQPENINFQKNLADFYYVELGRVKNAMEIYVKILALNPRDIECLLMLGHISVSMEKFDDAKVFYIKVLEVDPDNVDARQNLDKIQKYEQDAAM